MNYTVESLRKDERPFQSLLYSVNAKTEQEAIEKHEKEFSFRKVIAIIKTYKYKKMI